MGTHIKEYFENSFDKAGENVAVLSMGTIELRYNGFKTQHLSEVSSFSKDAHTPVVGVVITINSPSPIISLIVMTADARKTIAEKVMGAHDNIAIANSLIQEIGNIVSTTVANSLSLYFDESISTTPPDVIEDLPESIINSVITHISEVEDHIVIVDVDLLVDNAPLECKTILFFEENMNYQLFGKRQVSAVKPETLEGVYYE